MQNEETRPANPVHALVHTPGPWRRWTAPDGRWCIQGDDKSLVAEILPWDESGCRKEDQDNANLIAESPEMLKVVAIIANATGDTDLEHAQELSQEILMRLKVV
jgi:hypothetical protein